MNHWKRGSEGIDRPGFQSNHLSMDRNHQKLNGSDVWERGISRELRSLRSEECFPEVRKNISDLNEETSSFCYFYVSVGALRNANWDFYFFILSGGFIRCCNVGRRNENEYNAMFLNSDLLSLCSRKLEIIVSKTLKMCYKYSHSSFIPKNKNWKLSSQMYFSKWLAYTFLF